MSRPPASTSGRPDQAEELLPWYINGRLAPRERALVEDWLADLPDREARLAFEGQIAGALRERVEELVPGQGLERLLAQARATGEATRGASRKPRNWIQRLSDWASGPKLAMALGLALAVQTGVVTLLWERPAPIEYRSPGGEPLATVRLSFREGTSEAAIRSLLLRVGARIVGGPNQLGEYWLAGVDGPADRLLEPLRASGLVADIVLDREGPDAER